MLKLAFVLISRSCWLLLCCGLNGWWCMLMQVTLVSYWVACVMTWGPPLPSSSLSSLPSSGRAGGFCVRGASALRLARASPRSSASSICTLVYTFEAVLLAAFWDDKLPLWLVLHGLLWCTVSLTMGWPCWLWQSFFVGYAEYGIWSAVVCSLWWQLVRRQRDICMIFSILVWTRWLCHPSGRYP